MKTETLDGIEETYHALYAQDEDGTYTLQVDGAAPKEKVAEFRNNNIELTNQMKALEAKMAGLDIEKLNTVFQTVQNMAQSESDKEMTSALEQGPDAVNALIERRAASVIEAMKSDFDTRYATVDANAQKYRSQLEEAKITSELSRLAAEKGVRPTAIDDVLLRGKQVFKLNNEGEVVAMKGDEVVFNKDNKPLSIGEYMDSLATSAPHLFEQSTGGGAANSTKSPGKKTSGFVYRGEEVPFSK